MNLFSTPPQNQVEFTGESMTGNWQNVFQHAMNQGASNTPFNQTIPKEQSEVLNFDSLLEMFGLSEEELIDLLQLVNETIGKDGIQSEHHANDSNEVNDTTLNKLETINELLMRLLNYEEVDYDELLAKLSITDSVDDAIIDQMQQFILTLKEMSLDEGDMQNGTIIADTFQTNLAELFINDDEMHHNETIVDEFIVEEKQIETIESVIQAEVVQMITRINRLLDGFMEKGTDLPRDILQMLGRWSQLQQEAPTLLAEVKEKLTSEKDGKIWQQLVQAYEKRQSFSKQLIYQAESSITKQDVHRWLEQAFSQYDQVASQSQSAMPVTQTMMPMNEVQQFEIHLQATNRVEKISNELVTQLTNVIQKSNFIQGRQMNQLTITLNPENLGNITVRLVEVDGEMTVKLLVTSNLTKKALETNIHQLKHMFSPHQISIEREEGISDEEFFAEEESLEDESLEEGNESEENDEETPEIDFEELLQQIREGEEVNDEN